MKILASLCLCAASLCAQSINLPNPLPSFVGPAWLYYQKAGVMASGCPIGQALTQITFTGGVCTPISGSGGGSTPGGTSGQFQWNNGGILAGITFAGDLNVAPLTGIATVKGLNGILLTGLPTGLLKNTGGTPSIALPNADYLAPISGSGIVSVTSNIPGLVVGPPGNCVLVNGTTGACVTFTGLGLGLIKNTSGTPTIALDCTDYVSPNCLNGGTVPGDLTLLQVTGNTYVGGNFNTGSSGQTGSFHPRDSAGTDHPLVALTTGLNLPNLQSLTVQLDSNAATAAVFGDTAPTQAVFGVFDNSKAAHFNVDRNYVTNIKALSFAGTNPTCAVGSGAGSGGSPVCSTSASNPNSTDHSGMITLTTGSSMSGVVAGNTIATVTMQQLHTAPPAVCQISSVGAVLSTSVMPQMTSPGEPSGSAPSSTTWYFVTSTSPLSASTTYTFSYECL